MELSPEENFLLNCPKREPEGPTININGLTIECDEAGCFVGYLMGREVFHSYHVEALYDLLINPEFRLPRGLL